MSIKMIDKAKLLIKLRLFKDSIKVENWNEYTRMWSKGKIQGVSEVIQQIEQCEEENTEES